MDIARVVRSGPVTASREQAGDRHTLIQLLPMQSAGADRHRRTDVDRGVERPRK